MFKKNHNLFLVVSALAGLFIFSFILNPSQGLVSNDTNSLEVYADQIIAKCSGENLRPQCYDREIPKLMDFISLEDAFKVTWFIQEKDSTYQYCHVVGHELSAREVSKDPSKWADVVFRCPSGMCSNGCPHGGFQERFRAAYLTESQIRETKPIFFALCEERSNWRPTGMEKASCYHALGHLLMYITNADLHKSAELCEEITKKNRHDSQVCFDGVFMQIFQPLEPEDFALVKDKQPTKQEVPTFCNAFNGKKRASCLSESWPLFLDNLQNPDGVVRFCEMTEVKERPRCYNAIFYVLSVQYNLNEEKIIPYCASLPGSIQGRCFANTASRMIEVDYRNIERAVAFCKRAEPFGQDNECFNELLKYSTFNFHPGSEPFFKLCNTLPNPWSERCLKRL